ncbi:activin types I and II receptor domain protein [Ditylenchus destructor]|uniref:Activin types I and II receptor domain protein n=1 Tax=Ditylenchus destructor TaxID=166010 RepID=A0AAD4R8I5_9BILA|nr:activin types I and II receptor domain protein [Ditylenchus destructor]
MRTFLIPFPVTATSVHGHPLRVKVRFLADFSHLLRISIFLSRAIKRLLSPIVDSAFIITFTLFILPHSVTSSRPIFECHSCLTSCQTSPNGQLDAETCDCTSDVANATENVGTCQAENCFTKIEFFPDELIAVIQKGCVNGLNKGVHGCHYAGQVESVHCYCSGHLCNNKEDMNSFAPQPLPTLECCECSQPGGDFCPGDACLRTCTGNYCLVDFDSVEQGCGMGLPRLQNFLRIPNYLENLQGETTCARYQASDSTVIHGCVCTRPNGMCNQLNKTRHYQLEHVVHRRVDNGNYCYSLHERGNETFDEKVFRKSDSCLGHYCFVSVTTSELVIEVKNASAADQTLTENTLNVVSHAVSYRGVARPRHEILAGCLKVDDDNKVTPGCTIEYSSDGEVLSRHCICDSHMCNYFDLINGTDFTKSSTEEENAEHSAMEVFHDDTELGSGTVGQFCSLYRYTFSLVALLFLYTQLMLT